MLFSIRAILAPSRSMLGVSTRSAWPRLSIWTRGIASSTGIHSATEKNKVDVAKLLRRPTWSLTNLSSGEEDVAKTISSEITSSKLQHLLRLSALPLAVSPEEQSSKSKALQTQLNFVRDVQNFDAAGSLPLQAIRDETRSAVKQRTIGVAEVAGFLLQEDYSGRNRRPRTRRGKASTPDSGNWDVLKTAAQTTGRHVIVGAAKENRS